MSHLFDGGSDSESEFKCDNEYAKNYNQWRKKEELNKLKSKYGEAYEAENSGESSSSDEDEEGVEITEQLEKEFFNTLASLKKKDPKIYDDNFKFFNETNAEAPAKKEKNKEKPMYIMDYERKMLLENGGELSDSDKEEEEDNPRARSPTYVEEQRQLKESLKKALNDSDDEGDEYGGLLKARVKTKEEKEKEESDYKKWLLGQKESLEDEDAENNLKPLKDYWNDPKLEEGEKFLRDYILNKRFLENEDENYIPTYEEIIHDSDEDLSEDEKQVKKQEEFEHKYNYRFEEPDQEYLKRYPRTVQNSLRRTDDSRKVKRQEVKERKQKEKEQKMQEIQKMKELKRQEIEEKIKKLREITGNTEVAFEDRDLDDDFDPEEHDKRMQALFNDEFYQGEEMDQKPEFPELDEELEIERWDNYNPEDEREDNDEGPHCEDENFNMDCDYDPKAVQRELIENSKGKKKRKRKSKFAKAISEPKPAFDPNDKTYEEYLDEYYKLDCEDIIGDVPCRFKYRKVVPNSFGLTIEEILMANDRELNRWASLKKATQHRPEHMEKYDQIAYAKKAQNEALKRKLLPSLYVQEKPEEPSTSGSNTDKKKKHVKKNKSNTRQTHDEETEAGNDNNASSNKNESINDESGINEAQTSNVVENTVSEAKGKKKNKKNKKNTQAFNDESAMSIEETSNVEEADKNGNTRKINGIPKESNLINNEASTNSSGDVNKPSEHTKQNRKKKNKKRKSAEATEENVSNKKMKLDGSVNSNKKANGNKQHKFNNNKNKITEFSDARLQAFGIKPKKFKNKLKYGNKK